MASDWRSELVIELQSAGVLLVEDGNHGEYRPRPDEFVERGVAFIRAADMDNGQVHFASASKINEVARTRITKGIGARGDVLLSHKGTVGKVAFVPEDAPEFVCSPQTTFWRVLNEEVLDRRYLYAFLRSPDFHRQLATRAGETDMAPYVSLTSQRGLTVSFPPVAEQRAIAQVLSALDDKIELNRKTNETLEAMARALFKSWFVDFDPVRAKAEGRAPSGMDAATAALFPGEFIDSALGPIPHRWGSRSVGELAVLSGGKQLDRELIADQGTIPVFGGAGVMGFTAEHNADGFVISVGRVGAYCGQFFAHRGRAWINNNASLIRPKDESISEWMFFALKFADIDVIKKGAAQPFVSNSDIAELKVMWPGEEVVAAFSAQVVPLLNARDVNDAESKTLANVRDELLPRLLSGKITVEDSERIVEEAV